MNKMKPSRRYSNGSQPQVSMNYSTFEAHYLQQNQLRRSTSSRNRYHSDLESDAGSDGLAVNSGGSGRSGDWVPSGNNSKRLSKRYISSDSGISTYKTDSSGSFISSHKTDSGGSFSDFSSKKSNSNSKCEIGKPEVKEFNYIPNSTQSKLVRSNSCSAITNQSVIPSQHIPSDQSTPEVFKIELKQKEILEQCYQNERLKDNINNPSIIDCRLNEHTAKFQSTEAINYPLSKHRYKSENSISNNSVKSFQKLKNGFKKMKLKKMKENEELNSKIASDMSYMEYAHVNEDNSDKILSRLSTNPSKKTFIRRIFNKLGGRSYSTQNVNRLSHQTISQPRNASTGSIPDKVSASLRREEQVNHTKGISQPSQSTLTKTRSMPSIAYPGIPDPRYNDNFITHYPPIDSSIHMQQFSNSDRNNIRKIENTKMNQNNLRTRSASSCDDLTYKKNFFNPKLAYAPYMSGTPIAHPLPSGTPISRQLPHGTPIARHHNFNYVQSYHMFHQQQLQRGYNNSYFIDPRMDPRMIQQRPQYCPCCQYGRQQPQRVSNMHNQQPIQEYIVAPLSVKVNNEKRAERKKVADVIFDTFV